MAYTRSFAAFTSVADGHGHHSASRELVVMDPEVSSPEVLLGGLSRPAEVLVLDASRPALPQITAALAAGRPVSALHVIAHGRSGAVRLGGEELTAEGLDGARAWRASLAPGATIALHACQAGAGEPGRALIEGLAAATGARVAASREDIGAGLPWRLDATSDGLAIAPIVGAAAQAAYPHRLPIPLVAGSETLVNTTTAGHQSNPTITGLSDGGYVVTWMSFIQDGWGYGVYTQRYDAAGVAAGSETLVNTTTYNEQQIPTIAGLSDGGYVVTWMSFGQDGSGWGVYAQRYDAAGAAVGSETLVNTTTVSAQYAPTVTGLSGGGYVVTWTSLGQDGSGWGAYAQRYDAAGVAAGGETQVNTATASDQFYPEVTGLSDGGYVVTWTSYSQDGSGWGVYTQRYDAAGAAVGSETLVNTTTVNDQLYPAITGLSDGGYVVTWTSLGYDVYAQRYDAAGAAVGGETLVNTTTIHDQYVSAITGLSDGGYVVTWQSYNQDYIAGDGVYAQRYDAAGAAVGGETLVNTTTFDTQSNPTVTGLSDGGYVVTWMSLHQDGSGWGVYSKTFRPENADPVIVPTVMTFDDVAAQADTVAADYFHMDQYFEDGFTLTNSHVANLGNHALYAPQAGNPYWSGSNGIYSTQGYTSNSIAKNDGSAFGVASLDLDTAHLLSQSVTITGLKRDGGTVTQTFSPDLLRGFQTVTLAPAFHADLVRLTWSSNNSGDNRQVDNIVLLLDSGAVQEAVGQSSNASLSHQATGSLAFADVDLSDTHTAAATPQGSGYLGILTLGAVDQAANSVDWTFTVADAALDHLAAEETLTQTYLVAVSDGNGGTATHAVTITITGTNDAPVVTSNGGGSTAAVSLAENSTAVTTVTATDPDAGAALIYSLAGGQDVALFAIDALTGVVTFRTAPDFEAPLDAGGDNVYDVTVAASDGTLTTNQAVAISVTNQNEAPVGNSDTYSVDEDGSLTIAAPGILINDYDPEGSALFTLDLGTGTSHGSLVVYNGGSFVYTPNANFTGVDTFTYRPALIGYSSAVDIGAYTSVTINVMSVADAPIFTSGASASFAENAAGVVYAAIATDADNLGALTYSITGGTDAALFAIDAVTGVVTFRTAPDFEAPLDAGGDNVYDVTVTASDGTLTTNLAVAVSVTNVNEVPVITTVGGGAGDPLLVPENTAGSFATITAADPDAGQTLTFLIGPSADPTYDNEVFTIDPVTGALRFTAPPDFEFTDPGNDDLYKVAVQVSDGAGGTATRDVFVQVTNVTGISPPASNAATIVGTNEEDALIGLGGANTLLGLGGNDTLYGGGGNDLLDGGTGIDVMLGGAGNDTYVADSSGDLVFETTTTTSTIDAGGIDTVQSSVGFDLNAYAGVRFVENLTLTGTASINGTGNALANGMTGNAGNNVLNGGLGDDTLLGGAGNDTYVVDSTGDRVFETTSTTSSSDAGGIDTVQSSVDFKLNVYAGVRFVENLTLTGTASIDGTGNALANGLTGNAGNNVLSGGLGDDTLNGGLGNDRLLGGAGNDTFVFNTALGVGNIDRIVGFDVVDDTIRLDDAIFVGLATGTLAATAFAAGQAATASERIIYETDTGRLFYDSDGAGGAARVQFATLSAGLALTNADFFVF